VQDVFINEFLIAENLQIGAEPSEDLSRFFVGIFDSKSQTGIVLAPWFVDHEAAQLLREQLGRQKAQQQWLSRIFRRNTPVNISQEQLIELAKSVSISFQIESSADILPCTRVLTERIRHALRKREEFVFSLWDESAMPCICKIRVRLRQDRVDLLGQFLASEHRRDAAIDWTARVLSVWKNSNLLTT